MLLHPEGLKLDVPSQQISLLAKDTGGAAATTTVTTTDSISVDMGVGMVGEAEVHMPPLLGFGMREWERSMVFEHLPLLSMDMSIHQEMNSCRHIKGEEMTVHYEGALVTSIKQVNIVAMLLNLRNGNMARITLENWQRVTEVFSEPGMLNNTGRTEVQDVLFCFLHILYIWLGKICHHVSSSVVGHCCPSCLSLSVVVYVDGGHLLCFAVSYHPSSSTVSGGHLSLCTSVGHHRLSSAVVICHGETI
jgi:hypothetical protein